MRNRVSLLSVAGLALLFTGCSVLSPTMTKEKLLSNIRKQVDPDFKLKTAKTKVIIGKVDRGSDLAPARMVVKVKYPDKWRMLAVVPKEGVFIRAYNGKTAWEFSTKSGYKELTGRHFDELRLQADLAIYRGNYEHIFKTIKFDGEEKVSGEQCYKIIAQPKDIYNSQPIIFYIHKTSYLPYMMKESYDGTSGIFPVSTVFSDYKKQNGVMIAMTRIFTVEDNLIDITVQSVEWNEYIDDAEFNPPEQFQ